MTQRMNMLHNIMAISIFMVVTVALIPGCTSEPKQVSLPASADTNEEITLLNNDLSEAQKNQVNVLAPRNFDKARYHLGQAQEQREKSSGKGKDNQEVLKSIGLAKAYLNLAHEHAERVRPSTVDILKARSEALEAGASQLLPKNLAKADDELKDVTANAEKKRSSLKADKRADLQRNYLNLQVEALKISQLAAVENSIEAAKKNGAHRYAPKTLASAEAKLELASNVIETDRNNAASIRESSLEARKEATKLVAVTSIAKDNKASENVALELHARRLANQRMNEEISQTESLLKEEKAQTEQIRGENAELEKVKQLNETLAWAQQQFNANEAEVYRQGDQLLIRLKAMNYKSGQTELPASAYPLLGKVKEVISRVGAEKVKVEGHTDSIGTKILNQSLSQARAEGVAQYLSNEKIVSASQVEAEGLGFEKPLSTNKTPQGRAQNRRVDIIVTPGQATTATE